MDTAQTQRYILKRLSASAERDDIIREVCLRFGLNWQAAEALVGEVQEANASLIYRRQSPILITSLAVDSLLGAFLILLATAGLFLPAIERGTFHWVDVLNVIQGGHVMGYILLAGMAMLLGGLTGLVGVLYHIMRNEGSWEED